MKHPLDSAALGQLLDLHGRALENYARRWSNAPEDCVQEAFVKLAAEIPPPENQTAWLYRVVRNFAINDRRTEDRRQARERERSFTQGSDDSAPVDLRPLMASLRQLPSDLQEIVFLRIWGQLTWEQMAQVVGVSSSTAHRRYSEAIVQLKALWEEQCLN